jgi:FtsZ-binding cell division protein ZapB
MSMSGIVDILEERVAAAAALIASLRTQVRTLEQELALAAAAAAAPAPGADRAADPELAEELERLRAERVVVRESIRGLLREIDRVSW